MGDPVDLVPEHSSLHPAFRLLDVQWMERDILVWMEARSGRTTLVAGSLRQGWRRDLTRSWGVGAQVGYGGGDFTVAQSWIYFVDGCNLLRQAVGAATPHLLARFESPVCSPAVSPDGGLVAVVAGGRQRDSLAVVPATGGPITTVHEGPDFIMQPCWHPGGRRVAWIEWDVPQMPWDESRLAWACLETGSVPRLSHLKQLSVSGSAYFQPSYSPDGRFLAVVSDDTGWFNLSVLDPEQGTVQYRLDAEAEYAIPAWIHGLRTYGWSGTGASLVVTRSSEAAWAMEVWRPESGEVQHLAEFHGWTDLRQPATNPWDDSIAVLGSSTDLPHRLLVLRQGSLVELASSLPPVRSAGRARRKPQQPEHLKFGSGDTTCFGLYVEPARRAADSGALVIRIHGGPTSQFVQEYDEDAHYYLGLGMAVLSLNYRGSSGYGTAYRNQLKGGWGLLDVEDVVTAARELVEQGRVDPERILLTGGSAGGLTALLTLARHPGRFRGAVCRFPVVDLASLLGATHRFERHYLEGLLGPLMDLPDVYRDRSPLGSTDSIVDPVAIFHGDADKVAPLGPVERFVERLRRRKVPCVFQVFRGEGHGWRRWETVRGYYREVGRFLQSIGIGRSTTLLL
jgi:dipeptidyl aminopeptidase/acylaminoacyl peptidase